MSQAMKPAVNEKIGLTPEEAAPLLSIGVRKLIREAKAGNIPARLVGGSFRFSRVALEQWIVSPPEKPPAPYRAPKFYAVRERVKESKADVERGQ